MEQETFISWIQSMLLKFKSIKKLTDKLNFIYKFDIILNKFNFEINNFQELIYYIACDIFDKKYFILPKFTIFKLDIISETERKKNLNEEKIYSEIENFDILNFKNGLKSDWIEYKDYKMFFKNKNKENLNYISLNQYLNFIDQEIFFQFIINIKKNMDDKLILLKIILVFIKKLEILYYYFDKVINLDENDIYNLPYNDIKWINILNKINNIVF